MCVCVYVWNNYAFYDVSLFTTLICCVSRPSAYVVLQKLSCLGWIRSIAIYVISLCLKFIYVRITCVEISGIILPMLGNFLYERTILSCVSHQNVTYNGKNENEPIHIYRTSCVNRALNLTDFH